MAKHYYRTNVPLPVMIVWWVFLGICIVIASIYNYFANGPKERAQAQWDRDHFNGWRLEQNYPTSDNTAHGLYFDKLDKDTCTVKGYPGYPACPAQLYYVDGKPQSAVPPNPTSNR